ncbi:FecCD family ABC transporter permease [Marinomonas mediterranea]|jgi:ABC-type Fe3+-siderophore transport system, permease component|uniref:ABC-type transporter, integral membrane subunit n=1 Tax=Marinomonas mediterranea (strain ATCC 700492 / JCM 21426 / NBRC 103028 / MMB-1) TaxID=717774 RepID=F2K3S1_MARM1|nr:iron ABC transporter permease [Marinomonas mediterranea]ADZ90170.1 ABC-type transporter, integral membrane subunit [Marinomonas mediterranea MMB-1]WCN08233.1 iron chelate uptake ABC transporter family permease subunit [Marinomonas mediterranea]WCN12299.1 iron chelate uptake ABC transporter family permease subunit [Marinomonas mediterranea]WCN16371.1 iron chelate uptake ABC transporter family permease subunit [Marinomonas mediterranea MMB-1]
MPLLSVIGAASYRSFFLFVSFVLIAIALIFGVAIGETNIDISIVIKSLLNGLFDQNWAVNPIDQGIIWNYRFTRTIVAGCCGAALAITGLVLQSLLRNALADPYLLGISAGASTGAVMVTIAGIGAGVLSMSFGALIGALMAFAFVAMLAVLATGRFASEISSQVILAGIAGSQLFNALTAFIIAKSANAEQARGIMFWLLGNLSGVRWNEVALAVPVLVIGLALVLWHGRALDAFLFGNDAAASVGIPVRRVQVVLIGATAMMTAVMVSMVGAIGFVGLVVPHAARFLFGSKHLVLIPACAVIGAVFLIVCDIGARTIMSGQVLPIGVVTALIGAPCFAVILVRGSKK